MSLILRNLSRNKTYIISKESLSINKQNSKDV